MTHMPDAGSKTIGKGFDINFSHNQSMGNKATL